MNTYELIKVAAICVAAKREETLIALLAPIGKHGEQGEHARGKYETTITLSDCMTVICK